MAELGDFCIGVGAFPDLHPQSRDADLDARILVAKQKAGASFAITQLFFTAQRYFDLVDRVRALGSDLPIIPGIMPVTRISQIERFADLSGAPLPAFVTDRLRAVGDDPARVRGVGGRPGHHAVRGAARGRGAGAALHHHEPVARHPRDLRPSRPAAEPRRKKFRRRACADARVSFRMTTWADRSTSGRPPVGLRSMGPVPVNPSPATYVGGILTAVRAFQQSRVLATLDDAYATHGLGTTIDEVVLPSLRVVGTFWSSGTIDVAHEHLLSTAVARWVAARSAVLPAPSRTGTILLAAGPQDMHTLALDCLDLLLASRGVEICNLGAQTPVESLRVAARSLRPTAVVLSLPHADRREPGRPLGPGRRRARPPRLLRRLVLRLAVLPREHPGRPARRDAPGGGRAAQPAAHHRARRPGPRRRASRAVGRRASLVPDRRQTPVDGDRSRTRTSVAGGAPALRAGRAARRRARPRSRVTSRWVGRVRAT